MSAEYTGRAFTAACDNADRPPQIMVRQTRYGWL